MIDSEIFAEVTRLRIASRIAVHDCNNLTEVGELLELTTQIVSDESLAEVDIRTYLKIRAQCLATLVNCIDEEHHTEYVEQLLHMLKLSWDRYSPCFVNPDLRTRLLAMRRFMDVSSALNRVEKTKLTGLPELEVYLHRYLDTKERCKVPSK